MILSRGYMERPRLMVTVVIACVLAACGSEDATVSSDPGTVDDPTAVATAAAVASQTPVSTPTADPLPTGSVTTETQASQPEAEGFPRQVEHAMGTTEVPARPERIVALDLSLADATVALGRPLLGYTLYQDPDGDLPDYFDAAPVDLIAGAQYLGELLEPDLEAIAAADPDVIITSVVRHEAFYDELAAIAPTIMSKSTGTRWKENIWLTAEALGEEDRVEDVLGVYEDRAAAVGQAINQTRDDPVVSVVRFRSAQDFSLYQRASFSGIVLDDAGLARPENQQATDPEEFRIDVSTENLDQADAGADVFFYTFPGNDDAADDRTDEARVPVTSGPLWQQLLTVSSGDAHEVSEEVWMSAVGLFGANAILDDLAETFDVDPAR